MRSVLIWLVILGVVVAGVVAGLRLFARVDSSVPPTSEVEVVGRVGAAVPAFQLPDISGATVASSDFTGKPLVVNSWASWCPFCLRELQDFAVIQREFGEQVAIVAINRAESSDVVQQFATEFGVARDLILLVDESDSYYEALGGFFIPETLFVSADGVVQFHHRGPLAQEEIRKRVQRLLAPPAAASRTE